MLELTNAIYTDANKAREHLESIQWPDGPVCPHCGNVDQARISKMEGKSTRPGVYKCKECRKPFTVTVGTVFERSHIPLNKWVMAAHLMAASKKGISAHQLHRMLGVTYKSAWFMAHRIREAMKEDNNTSGPIGGEGKIVEADETYLGKRDGKPSQPDTFISGFGWVSHPKIDNQKKIVALVERGGSARSFMVSRVDKKTVRNVLFRNADRKSVLMTDEASVYPAIGAHYADHHTVNHSKKEYARGRVSTNTVEGFFSIFKRGMKGIYQHCSEAHLPRYLAEFDFRYNRRASLKVSDTERAAMLLEAIRGKRLTYRRIDEARYA